MAVLEPHVLELENMSMHLTHAMHHANAAKELYCVL